MINVLLTVLGVVVVSAQHSPGSHGNKETLRKSTVAEGGVHYSNVFQLVERGDHARVQENQFDDVSYFCYNGTEPGIGRFWSTASLKLDMDSSDYQVYVGSNLTSVNELHKLSETAWIYSQLPWKTKEFKINPFQRTCVGVVTHHQYSLHLQIKHVNYYMLILTAIGISMFIMAPKLCRNQFFHFTTGISAGILLSVLILTFMIQKRLKIPAFSWIGLVYSLSIYFITSTWYNLKEYLTDQYYHWVLGYLLGSGIISFAIIYRMGPPTNNRTLNLIQWTMQAVSLVLIVLSSYYQTASLSLAILLLIWRLIPAYCKSAAQTQFRRRFLKPKIKLLTEDEYMAQAREETDRALAELRTYCQSPESKPWKTVRVLKSPGRFAEFIEGSPHITEEEVLDYSHWDANETDDEDNDDRVSLTDDEDEDRLGNRSFDAQM